MYDWAHGLEDAIEGITHSVCTLEFEDHRPLYDWFIDQLPGVHHPQQIEFARLNIDCTVMSKRKLLQLVTERFVDGWDDPRMPTVCGLRRRGFTPESIKEFCDKIGVSKVDSTVHFSEGRFNRPFFVFGILSAHRFEPTGSAADGGSAPVKADDYQLPGR